MSLGVRTAATSLWDTIQLARAISPEMKKVRSIGALLCYAAENGAWGSRRKVPVEIKPLVERWVRVIRTLSVAHDKAETDKAEHEMDECLTPLLGAPVKQIREFYGELVLALEADAAVPFFVHAMFRAWGEIILKKAPDEEIMALKVELAQEIAVMVEQDVRPDLAAAIAGALKWRAPEALTKIRDAVKGGSKARIVGRESCLFLEVGDATVML